MRILLLHQFFLEDNDPGGTRFNKLVEHWSKKGHEITIIAGTVNYATGKSREKYKGKYITREKKSDKVEVYRCHVSKRYNKSFIGRTLGYFSFNFSSTAALFRIKKPDIILVTSPPLFIGLTGIIAKKILKRPLIFEIRDLWPESAIDTGILTNKAIIKLSYMIEKLCYEQADKINVLTPAFKDKLVRNKNVNPDKIIYIPNGADLDIFKEDVQASSLRKDYNLEDKFIITYTGAHGVANDLIRILLAAKEAEKVDKDLHFVLIGAGMKKEELIQYKEKHNLANVTFVEAQPKTVMPSYLKDSDACIAVLKKNDTFKTVYPNKMFDYMASKRPILMGIDGIARELVENNKAGYYIDPESPSDIVTKAIELKNNPDLRNEMGVNGYNFVVNNFDRHKLADDYLFEMEKIVGYESDFKNNTVEFPKETVDNSIRERAEQE